MRAYIKIVTGGAIAATALAFCMGNTSCGSAGGTTGNGSLVAVGNVPVQIARPYGIAVRGSHTGSAVWVLGGAAASGAAIAAATRHALRLVGGTDVGLSSTGDPCRNRGDNIKAQNWNIKNRNSFLDCGAWRQIRKQYRNIGPKDFQKVLFCIQKILTLGVYSNASYGTVVTWDKGSVIMNDQGRITSTSSEGWRQCGHFA